MERIKNRQGISASTLKVIAVITMLIDHIAAAVLVRMLWTGMTGTTGVTREEFIDIYMVMRQIGRTAFPIYCYMLVEGLKYTRNQWKYLARLGAFALISEVPFDLAFHSKVLEFSYQNVYFTLFFGLLTLIVIKEFAEKSFLKQRIAARSILIAVTAGAGMGLAALFRTDYGAYGVCCIIVLYMLRERKVLQMFAGYAAFVILLDEWAAFPAFLLIPLYRGKKGFSAKWFFYGFYPVHLLAIYYACVCMGISYCPALR